MADTLKDKACIVGIGETEYSKNSGRSEMRLALEAIMAACEDAGIGPKEIDGIVRFSVDSNQIDEVARNLGLENVRFFPEVFFGGGAGCGTLQMAAMAVALGKEVVARDKAPESVLVALKEAQSRLGYLPQELMAELAVSLDVPANDVYGVASFYSFLSTKPLGRNVIRICKSLPCYLKKSQIIIETVEKELGIKPGETTPDGRFSFELTNCIGLCDKAPAMLINNDAHVDLTPGKISKILQNYK